MVRKYLQQLIYSEHDLRFEPLPSGRGCGEQWVRNRYEKAVAAHRARSVRVKPALVVAIDADKGDMNRPLKQLEQAPINARLRPRAIDERVVRPIPERNIETRIRVLNGKDGDEHADYS